MEYNKRFESVFFYHQLVLRWSDIAHGLTLKTQQSCNFIIYDNPPPFVENSLAFDKVVLVF